MSSDIGQALREVAEEAFETTAFMFVIGDGDDGAPRTEASIAAVPFKGPLCGTLVVVAAEEMLPELAGNMLGLAEDEDPPSPEQQHDAFKELANVVCGNLLPCIAGKEAVFDVQAPRLVGPEDLQAMIADREPTAELHLDVDCGWADLTVYLCRETAETDAVA